ncbi:dihydrodipicolinate synthase family protein [Bacillus sp. SL00103]
MDEPAFRKLVRWVADHKGINGIVVNGHTGEIMTLLPHERAEAVRIAADELKGKYLSFLGFSAEGQLKQSSMQKPLKKLVEKVYCSCRHIHG